MPDLFVKLQTEKRKSEREIKYRERQAQFQSGKRVERERICKLIRETSPAIMLDDKNKYYEVEEETLSKIERGEL